MDFLSQPRDPLFSKRQHCLLDTTPQETYLLQALQHTNVTPEDLLVLACRLKNDPIFATRFRKIIYGFLDPSKLSFIEKQLKQ